MGAVRSTPTVAPVPVLIKLPHVAMWRPGCRHRMTFSAPTRSRRHLGPEAPPWGRVSWSIDKSLVNTLIN